MSQFSTTESFRQILTFLPSSRMEEKEKQMWMMLLPNLDERLLDKLAHILQEEHDYFLKLGVDTLTSYYSQTT